MKCGSYGEIEKIYYCMPGFDSFEKGLKKVYDENEIRELGELALKWRAVDFYVVHGGDKFDLEIDTQPNQNAPHQNASSQPNQEVNNLESESNPAASAPTAIDASTSAGEGPHQPSPNKPYQYPTQSQKTHTNTQVPEDYDWEDPKLENPLSWNELLGDDLRSEDSDSDPEYTSLSTNSDEELAGGEGREEVPDDDEDDVGEGRPNEEFDDLFEGEINDEHDTSDEEYISVKERVKRCRSKLIEIAQKLQQDVADEADEALSDYGDSGDDIDTPPGSDEEELSAEKELPKEEEKPIDHGEQQKKRGKIGCEMPDLIGLLRRLLRQLGELIIVKKNFAYKVKYYAQKKLHGSMKEHYLKLGRQEMEKSTALICPRVQAKLEKEKEEATKCTVLPSTSKVFETNHFLDSLTVDLDLKSCTCRKWDMCGFPCCHAIAAIFFCHMQPEDFGDECFRRDVFLRAYAGSIPACERERH
ncbi:Polycystic kidney disease protein 1-like 3 [Bienertia sinuspersici]